MRSFRPIEYSRFFKLQGGPFWYRKLGAGLGYIKNFVELSKWWMHKSFHGLPLLDSGKIRKDSIPVLLNNFNRLDSLHALLHWILQLEGEKSIIILDNNSTYPPLLEYYRTLNYPNVQVLHLGINSYPICIKHYKKELSEFPKLVVSDCDLMPYPNTPNDILLRMCDLLDKHPQFTHAGASLRFDDIPDHYPLKNLVMKWEKKFWPPEATLVDNEACIADVDTTFAMWKSGVALDALSPAIRLLPPYTLKHVDWYLDPKGLSGEYEYYIKHCSPYATWAKELRQALKN